MKELSAKQRRILEFIQGVHRRARLPAEHPPDPGGLRHQLHLRGGLQPAHPGEAGLHPARPRGLPRHRAPGAGRPAAPRGPRADHRHHRRRPAHPRPHRRYLAALRPRGDAGGLPGHGGRPRERLRPPREGQLHDRRAGQRRRHRHHGRRPPAPATATWWPPGSSASRRPRSSGSTARARRSASSRPTRRCSPSAPTPTTSRCRAGSIGAVRALPLAARRAPPQRYNLPVDACRRRARKPRERPAVGRAAPPHRRSERPVRHAPKGR